MPWTQVLIVVLVSGLLVPVLLLGRFLRALRRRELALTATVQVRSPLREDLPPAVLRLAERAGATGEAIAVRIRQRGEMWMEPGAPSRAFSAEQVVRCDRIGFQWRARLGPVLVADHADRGKGGLEARLLGALPIVNEAGSEVGLGQTLRYLAELPWAPDAILLNREFEWHVIDEESVLAAADTPGGRAAVTLVVDEHGDVVAASAEQRPRAEKGRSVMRPWRGAFSDHQAIGGRRIPRQGEVSWIIDGTPFVYWRGEIVAAELIPATR